MKDLIAEFRWRGFLSQTTSDDVAEFLLSERRTMYVGFDPTAASLHLGSLVPVMGLAEAAMREADALGPFAIVTGGAAWGPMLERLARAQLAAGDRAQAGKTYNQLTTLAPSRASGWLGLAQLRFLDKDLAGAEREVKRALEAEPASANAQRLLIQLTLRQGRTDAGLAMLHERQKLLPQEAFGYITEAEVELGRGRNDAGIALRCAARAASRCVSATHCSNQSRPTSSASV